MPPVERVQQRVPINGSQIGNQIRIIWQMPARNAPDGSILNIERADIYRLAEPLDAPIGLTEAEFASRSTLIASVPFSESDFALKEKTFVDRLQFAGQPARLRYAIRFVNASGQKAGFSNFLIIEPSPRIAQSPTVLRAGVTQNLITLNWDAPQANVDASLPPNILGYNLYRSSINESIKRLNETPIDDTTFDDRFFEFDQTYRYFVRTVSIGSNGEQVESLNSETLEITPKDTFPPAPPEALTIAVAPDNISIFFAINPETDVVGYKIFRAADRNQPLSEWTLLNEELLNANTFQDRTVESGRTYFYYVRAVDRFGNISEPSEIVTETAL